VARASDLAVKRPRAVSHHLPQPNWCRRLLGHGSERSECISLLSVSDVLAVISAEQMESDDPQNPGEPRKNCNVCFAIACRVA